MPYRPKASNPSPAELHKFSRRIQSRPRVNILNRVDPRRTIFKELIPQSLTDQERNSRFASKYESRLPHGPALFPLHRNLAPWNEQRRLSRPKQKENREVQALTICSKRKTIAEARIPAHFSGPEPPSFATEIRIASISLGQRMPTVKPTQRIADAAPKPYEVHHKSRTMAPLQELRKSILVHTGILM